VHLNLSETENIVLWTLNWMELPACKFLFYASRNVQYTECTRVYPKVSGLATWSKNCKWYSSLPLGAVVSLFLSQSSEFCRHNPLCCFSTNNTKHKHIFCYWLIPETFGYTFVYYVHLEDGGSMDLQYDMLVSYHNIRKLRLGSSLPWKISNFAMCTIILMYHRYCAIICFTDLSYYV
jgi:hypothetical protein